MKIASMSIGQFDPKHDFSVVYFNTMNTRRWSVRLGSPAMLKSYAQSKTYQAGTTVNFGCKLIHRRLRSLRRSQDLLTFFFNTSALFSKEADLTRQAVSFAHATCIGKKIFSPRLLEFDFSNKCIKLCLQEGIHKKVGWL